MPAAELVGHPPFGRLTVLNREPSQNGKAMWRCACDCGGETVATTGNLKSGLIVSCGCFGKEARLAGTTKHGMVHTQEHNAWSGAKARCANPKNKDYGGRGITMCARWRNSFENFYADVGPAPGRKHSIDREDNSKGYEPGNVRWVIRKVQNRNTRHNRLVEFHGCKKPLSEWAERFGMKRNTLVTRLNGGWLVFSALMTPVGEPRVQEPAAQ